MRNSPTKELQFILLLFFILFLLLPQNISKAQNKYQQSFYGGLFFISDYITSTEFQETEKTTDDFNQVDKIYNKALEFFDGDVSEALLCLTFACLPYNKIKVRAPFNTQLVIPLPSAPQKIFNAKLELLPSKIFFDSPQNNFGDKDKLSHFFGNAFLRYNFGFFNLSKFIGIFVENIEEALFVEGGFDKRDIIANHLGELFGDILRKNKNVKPSDILNVYQLLFLRLQQ